MTATVTRKGQVTIPKPMRDRLGLSPGSSVGFRLDGEGMHAGRQLVGEQRVDHAVHLDAALALEGRGGDADAVMCLAARPRAMMALVQMRLVDHI